MNLENLKCQGKEKVLLGTYRNYDYYSKCDYGDQKVKIGDIEYSLKEAIEVVGLRDELEANLKVYKKLLISNIKIVEEKNYKDLQGFYRYKVCDSIVELDINERIKNSAPQKQKVITKQPKIA